MELELGLAPPNTKHLLGDTTEVDSAACRGGSGTKRGFGEAFDEEEKTQAAATLPLFDDGGSSSGSVRKQKKAALVVGWPPVRAARHGGHVKVWKEGVGIGRKVDVSRQGSYGGLLDTLARMFPDEKETRGQHDDDGDDRGLVITYEDADGDWMLVGDVPWE